MRLNIGNRVRVINCCNKPELINKIGVLRKDDKDWKPYKVYFEDIDEDYWFNEDQLELVNKKPTKQELLKMPTGTKIYTDAENEEYQEWIKTTKNSFVNGEYDECIDEDDIGDNLTIDIYGDEYGTKIIKIEKPTYETVYDYSTEVQEMTVAEIEKALGHAVKIIKEDK